MKPRPRSWFFPALACSLVVTLLSSMARNTRPYGQERAADQSYNLLVQGFQAGQLSLKKEVPAGFAQLADPYDPDANEVYRRPPYWLHDLSYYRGKFYLYFGVSPAVLLFWPWAAVTGTFLSHESAVGVFCVVQFLAATAILLGLWRRFFLKIKSGVAAGGILLLGLATGMPIILQRADFYEVAISCGFALTTLSVGALCLAILRPQRQAQWLAGASLAYGLAVGARPSLLLGALILAVPMIRAWKQPGATARHFPWKLLAAGSIPIGLCAIGLLLYNHQRFGSPFEFGQRYQLAGDRFYGPGSFQLRYLGFNLRVYAFEPVHPLRGFPFFGDSVQLPPPPGHAPVESGGGILRYLPVLALSFLAPLALRREAQPSVGALRWIVTTLALWLTGLAVVLCLFFGCTWRYETELLIPLGLLAGVGILGFETMLAGMRRLVFRLCWITLLVVSVTFNLLEGIWYHAQEINLSAARLMSLGQMQRGLAQLDQAVKLAPGFTTAQTNRAVAYNKLGAYDRAIADATAALALNPSQAEAYSARGDAEAGKNEYAQAIADYEQAVRFNPQLDATYNNAAWLRATCPLAEFRDGAKALSYAEKACELTHWRSIDDIDTLAAASAAAGKFEDAVKWENRYLASAPGPAAAASARERLALYTGRKPYIEAEKSR